MSREMRRLRNCFQPRQWFRTEGEPEPFTVSDEDALMWVYRKQDDRFEVGYFMPDGTWFRDGTFDTADAAAERVNFLNGGRRQ